MQSMKLYIENINYSVSKEELHDLFEQYGTITELEIIEGKGFGYVALSNQEEAEKAKKAIDGYMFRGRSLKVTESRPQSSNM